MTQDLTAQRIALAALGVPGDRIYLDHGFTGTDWKRPAHPGPGPRRGAGGRHSPHHPEAGPARPVGSRRAGHHRESLSERGVRFQLGASVYDWNDPMAKMFVQMLAVFAEFEADLIRMRSREGMDIARQNGKLRGKQPSLKPAQDREIRRMHNSGDYNVAEIAALFSVKRADRVPVPATSGAGLPPLPADTRPAPDVAKYDQLLTRPR